MNRQMRRQAARSLGHRGTKAKRRNAAAPSAEAIADELQRRYAMEQVRKDQERQQQRAMQTARAAAMGLWTPEMEQARRAQTGR